MQHMELSAAKYTRLRKLIGGVREQMGYEETFGTPMEELAHIAPPSRWQSSMPALLKQMSTNKCCTASGKLQGKDLKWEVGEENRS